MANPSDASTLGDVLAAFEVEGYTAQMAARADGYVRCMACHQDSPADELRVDAIERTEGVSDPDDMLAVVAAVCPVCQSQGTLVLGYGPEAAAEDAEVLARLGDVDT